MWKYITQPCLAAWLDFEFLFPEEPGHSCELLYFLFTPVTFYTCQACEVDYPSFVISDDGCQFPTDWDCLIVEMRC